MRRSSVISRLRNAPPLSDRLAVAYVSENLALFLWMRAVHVLIGRPFLRRIDRQHGFTVDLIPAGLGGSAGASASGSLQSQFHVLDAAQEDGDE